MKDAPSIIERSKLYFISDKNGKSFCQRHFHSDLSFVINTFIDTVFPHNGLFYYFEIKIFLENFQLVWGSLLNVQKVLDFLVSIF